MDTPAIRRAEMPSNNGGGCARGMAKVAAAMANKGRQLIYLSSYLLSLVTGELNGARILSEEGWQKLHGDFTSKRDAMILNAITCMSQGGIGKFL